MPVRQVDLRSRTMFPDQNPRMQASHLPSGDQSNPNTFSFSNSTRRRRSSPLMGCISADVVHRGRGSTSLRQSGQIPCENCASVRSVMYSSTECQ